MRFKLYREYGALNSIPIFDAFEKGLKSLGHEIVSENEDISVIWSVLWAGRMLKNKFVYENCKKSNRHIMIIEVGNFKRGETWRISLNNINNLGIFGNDSDLDLDRPEKIGVVLQPIKENRNKSILIAAQHEQSLQWEGMPSMKKWCENLISQIRNHTKREIIVRPHPRSLFSLDFPGVVVERPKKILNTYDSFDIDYNHHLVINHNSGPAVQAAISGIPIFCDQSSLAGPISIKLENLENPVVPNREEWFLKLCHTEWTVDEIVRGLPQQRLISKIS